MAEWKQLNRSRLFVALTVIQAVSLLFLVSLYGLTGSRAPTAVVLSDRGPAGRIFLQELATDHHSFQLKRMTLPQAMPELRRGNLVAVINIQAGFTADYSKGRDTTVNVAVDNVDTDMTDDIQRAIPAAIVDMGDKMHLPGIRLRAVEHDLIDHDTGFIPYLVVSGLVLDAFVVAAILSAMALAREFESGTITYLNLAPAGPFPSVLGRVCATGTLAAAAMVFPVGLVVLGYGVRPLQPFEMVATLLLCVIVFSCLGTAIGALVRRTLPVASLIFGIALPLYICSGSLEPTRFDGNTVWMIAHGSPVYYGVGVMEHAVNGLQVTPESIGTDLAALALWALASMGLAALALNYAVLTTSSRRER